MQGEWSFYGGGQFNGRENGHVEVASLREGEWSCYGGCYFNGRENGHITEVVTSMEGEWSCYRGSHLNRGRMVTLQRWS